MAAAIGSDGGIYSHDIVVVLSGWSVLDDLTAAAGAIHIVW